MGRGVRRALGVSAPDKIIYTGKRIRGVLARLRCYLRYSWDTPAYSLARMCNFLRAGDEIGLGNEVQYFWGRPWPHTDKDLKRWRVCNIPYPADELDEERLIIMACIAEQLADAFNNLISRGLPRAAPEVGVEYPKGTNFGLESPPAWCSLVVNHGIQVNLGLRYSFKTDLPELCAPNFLKRGIKVDKHFIKMLSTDERKIVVRAMRIEVIILVSQSTTDAIKKIVQSDILQRHFTEQIWDNTLRQLRREGHEALCERSKLQNFDEKHIARTILGNMREALQNLKDIRPAETNVTNIELWDAAWQEQRAKGKRMKALDAESLPKRVRVTQDSAAGHTDVTGTGAITRTAFNAQCAHLIGIPHAAISEGQRVGAGAFEEVKEITIRGLSFFPEHIIYCAKAYKGNTLAKFESFQIEQGMQVLHPSIVRCIAFTTEAPWITIFAYYNGGTLGEMMLKLPFRMSNFTRAMYRLDRGWKALPPPDENISELTKNRILSVVQNMPNIMHAIVYGMAAAHNAGILHTDFHPFNVMLDFTKDSQARVGIIDWGLLLRAPKQRPSLNYVFEPDKNPEKVAEAMQCADREGPKRGWMAPELYDYHLENAYMGASDVFALGYLLDTLYEFTKVAQRLWMPGSLPFEAILESIIYKVRNWMLCPARDDRKSILQVADFFKSLPTQPTRAQRPLIELTVSFVHQS